MKKLFYLTAYTLFAYFVIYSQEVSYFDLPGIDDEVVANIIKHCSYDELLYLSQTSKRMHTLALPVLSLLKQQQWFETKLRKERTLLTGADSKIKILYPNVFDKPLFEQVKTLLLFMNRLTQLDSNLLHKFKNLKRLDLEYNKLSQLPQGLFKGLHNLHTINPADNELMQLNSDLFQDQSNLKYLNFHDNKLSCLPPLIFANQLNLQKLDLSLNHLTQLSPLIFMHLINYESFAFVKINSNS